jgi:hypothetical protein
LSPDKGTDLSDDEAMRLLLVLAGFCAVIGLAAPAKADPDDDFLAALQNAGITYKGGADAIGIGHRACQLMDQGNAEADVVKNMAQQNPGFGDAAQFTRIAENVYCPQHNGGIVWQPLPQGGFPWFPPPGGAA